MAKNLTTIVKSGTTEVELNRGLPRAYRKRGNAKKAYKEKVNRFT